MLSQPERHVYSLPKFGFFFCYNGIYSTGFHLIVSSLTTLNLFLSGFISSLPQLAWEKGYVVVVVVVVVFILPLQIM